MHIITHYYIPVRHKTVQKPSCLVSAQRTLAMGNMQNMQYLIVIWNHILCNDIFYNISSYPSICRTQGIAMMIFQCVFFIYGAKHMIVQGFVLGSVRTRYRAWQIMWEQINSHQDTNYLYAHHFDIESSHQGICYAIVIFCMDPK